MAGGRQPAPGGRRVAASDPPSPVGLGAALRLAWTGYQRRLDEHMAKAGFGDRGFPDGRVLRICARAAVGDDVTISQIGRELGITRQGAGKVVNKLRERQYVTVTASTVSGREKVVELTPRATAYLAEHRLAARSIERQLLDELGGKVFEALSRLLAALDGGDQPRLREHLRTAGHPGDPAGTGSGKGGG